ncbi:unnamed protein product [Ostreobium quekettii]|uniref:PsbP C-terminal domain-containing protein n=1 Tax=Ostreobium quekettii TaxID=121088 RepID=A0A8S1J0D6_9CHLO|nr:unnamed protein product [Ostreobium quekettii]|eukprot:evm.model.scf_266.4 EVM.evm.TU.scf_266.4   scf_266:92644-95182(-)
MLQRHAAGAAPGAARPPVPPRTRMLTRAASSPPSSLRSDQPDPPPTRRQIIESSAAALAGSIGLAAVGGPAAADDAVKLPKGFNPVRDLNDGYQFLYPFGWQEVVVDGQDAVYKDIIEPLESVSVSVVATDKGDITDFGSAEEVAETLVSKVLSGPRTPATLKATSQREIAGRNYYSFEYDVNGVNYVRKSLAVVAVGNGRFYTLATGASQRRWSKMEDALKTVVKSFQLIATREPL